MRLVKGISRDGVACIEAARADGAFSSLADLVRRSGARRGVVARLAAANAFQSLGIDRREAVWGALAGSGDGLPLLEGMDIVEQRPSLKKMTLEERVIGDYDVVGLSLEAHPISLVRAELAAAGLRQAKSLKRMPRGSRVSVAGLVLVRQRPSTAKGIVFMTLEDESGVANLIIKPDVYERCRRAARGAVGLIADGKIERQGEVVHVQVSHLRELGSVLPRTRSRDFH